MPTKNEISADPAVAEALAELAGRAAECRGCDLYKSAHNLVFSDGSPSARLVFVGEAPGADEDAQGKPFVGRAGQLLTKTIIQCGLRREDVYICNILKHRPPENRNPNPLEIQACTPFLNEQLAIMKPALIVTLGNFSTKFLLETEEGITKLRGSMRQSPRGYLVMPCLHPAAILRNPNQLTEFQGDIARAIAYVRDK
jgi:DNA polymerase